MEQLNNIKSIEVIDNKYVVTIQMGDKKVEVLTLSYDEFNRLFNIFKTASVLSTGVAKIVEDAKPVYDIEQRLQEFKDELFKNVQEEIGYAKRAISSLTASVNQIISEDGVYEKINQEALNKITLTANALKGLNEINTEALNRLTNTEKQTKDALALMTKTSNLTNLELEQVKRTSESMRQIHSQTQTALQQIEHSQKQLTKSIENMEEKIHRTSKEIVDIEIENLRKMYSKYTEMTDIRNEVAAEIANQELRRLAISEAAQLKYEEEARQHREMLDKTNILIGEIEKNRELINNVSEQARNEMRKKVLSIIEITKQHPGNFDAILEKVSFLMERYETKQRKLMHNLEIGIMQEVKAESDKEKKAGTLVTKVKRIFGK